MLCGWFGHAPAWLPLRTISRSARRKQKRSQVRVRRRAITAPAMTETAIDKIIGKG